MVTNLPFLLKDYPHPEREGYVLEPSPILTDSFTGMGAVKEGGCPSCPLHKRDIRMKSSTYNYLKLKYDVLDIYYIYSFFSIK
jgi:hypothetical protein